MNRTLTVQRGVDSKATSNTLAIYCSHSSGSEELNGILCQRACTIDPGKARTFDIELSDVELFAVMEEDGSKKIVGRYSIDSTHHFAKLYLRRNPKSEDGHEFVFSERTKNFMRFNRRFIGIIGAAVAILIIFLGFAIFYLIQNAKNRSKLPSQFETEKFSITLSEAFEQELQNDDYYTVFYTPDPCVVSITEDSFHTMPSLADMTLQEYCELLMEVNHDDHLNIIVEDEMMYYVDETDVRDERYIIYTYVYKTDDAFWFVEFSSTDERSDYWDDCYHEWAKSIKFK